MKKLLFGSIIGLLGSIGVVICDIRFVKWLFSFVPVSEYAGLIKIVIVFIAIWITAGICIIPFVVGISIGALLSRED